MLAKLPEPVEIAEGVHWIGALDPDLRIFDLILKTANGTTYNAYTVRGPKGVVVVDTVKEEFSEEFFSRLEQVASYDEIRAVILNHLEPDHTGAVPELMRRAPQAHIFCSVRALKVLTALMKDELDNYGYTLTDTGDRCALSGRPISFVNTPYLHWPDTQCTFLEDEKLLFSGDVFGCHFCDDRLYNDRVGDFRFSFEYYFKHIMRPFKRWVLQAVDKIEPLAPELIAPAHGPILRDNPLSYVRSYRTLSNSYLPNEVEGREKSLLVFYMSAYGATADMAKAVHDGGVGHRGRAGLALRPAGRRDGTLRRPHRERRRARLRLADGQWRCGEARLGRARLADLHRDPGQARRCLRLLWLVGRGGADDRGPAARPEDAGAGQGPQDQIPSDGKGTGRLPGLWPDAGGKPRRQGQAQGGRFRRSLERIPEKWDPVFGKEYALKQKVRAFRAIL